MKLSLKILVVLFLIDFAHSAEPPQELAAAKAQFQTDLASGSKLARDQYSQQLQKLKSIATTKKNRALLEAVEAEIKNLEKSAGLPYAKPVPGKPGYVTSPYEPYKGYIDVHGIPGGTQAICPYSMKPFLVPEISK